MKEILLDVKIELLEEGGYLITSDDLQGLVAQGQTLGEAMEIAQDVAKELILSYLAHGDVLPPKIQAALQKQPLAMKNEDYSSNWFDGRRIFRVRCRSRYSLCIW